MSLQKWAKGTVCVWMEGERVDFSKKKTGGRRIWIFLITLAYINNQNLK